MDIRIADLIFCIQNKDPRLARICSDFLVSQGEEKAEDKTEKIPLCSFPPEKYLHRFLPENLPVFQRDLNELISDMHDALEQHEGLLFHAASVAVDNRGYLFTAPPGTGKSTHISYWMDYLPIIGKNCTVICGDKPALRKIQGTWHVCGTPWKGKESWGNNEIVPVQALCVLERGEKNTVTPISPTEAVRHALIASPYPETEESMRRHLSLLEDFLTSTRCFRITCTMSIDAARRVWEKIGVE